MAPFAAHTPRPEYNFMSSFLKQAPKEQNSGINIRQYHEHPVGNQAINGDHTLDSSTCNESAVNANPHGTTTRYNAEGSEKDARSISPPSQAFDLNGDRRKRRKISLEAEHVGQEQQAAANAFQRTLDTQISRQLRQPVNASLRTEDCQLQDTGPTQVVPGTPKKRRGRPPKFATAPKRRTPQAKKELDAERAEDEATAVKTTASNLKQTPRKKTMQICTNGKLLQANLPGGETTSPQKSKTTTIRGAQTGTKMTLKSGKFTPTLIVILRYCPRSSNPDSTGARLESILSQPVRARAQEVSVERLPHAMSQAKPVTKTTHPFFRGKAAQRPPSSLSNALSVAPRGGTTGDPDVQMVSESQNPIPWKDIVFKSNKPFVSKDLRFEKPAWPPLAYQHTGAVERITAQSAPVPTHQTKKKSKALQIAISDGENILNAFGTRLAEQQGSASAVFSPQRLYLSGSDALDELQRGEHKISDAPAIAAARQLALQARSAFDRAEAAGPLSWPQQYSPLTWEEVLQPSCSVLYDWLKSLAVHNVKQGLDVAHPKQVVKRRKRQQKKKDDDGLNDFIASDDEQVEAKKVKNAILIVGPSGCGKTAAVYAVAKQLGFEVFEIHSGMRRSQKDIFDRVGDMAQNHMVQGGQLLSRDSSILHDVDTASNQEDPAQPSVANFFAQSNKKVLAKTSRPTTPQPFKQEQKQSLILFEEVDQIFEDDRGFWSGVQSLIQNSKRPVVLTCNDLHNIPLNELDLHQLLTFEAAPAETIAQYVTYIAAAEGHLINSDAIQALYRNKGNDLRATMTELDFWCQMTVGSKKGGLDWYPSATNIDKMRLPGQRHRVFSKETFHDGLDLLPTTLSDLEDGLQFAEDLLELPPDLFLGDFSSSTSFVSVVSRLDALTLLELRSDGEAVDPTAKRLLYTKMCQMKNGSSQTMDRLQVQQAITDKVRTTISTPISFDCLSPLASERPVFPPTQGRLAPTLDSPRSTLATDVAPYVRSIAVFDQKLEQTWDELFSSQGKKTRKTRAARAAAEGGDKASTRRERWFPMELDLQGVLATGNGWPQWHEGQIVLEDLVSTPASDAGSAMAS